MLCLYQYISVFEGTRDQNSYWGMVIVVKGVVMADVLSGHGDNGKRGSYGRFPVRAW